MTIPAPVSSSLPSIQPPPPSGLMPSTGLPRNTITTQPMGMPPRAATPPAEVATKNRSTQRLVVTANAAGKMASTRPLAGAPSAGALINLPAGMILRCLPAELLAAPLAEFEASGAAATEVGLPLHAIVSQLPSGKVELPLGEVAAQFPPGFLRPAEELAAQAGTMVNLPLMDVVMRIPPDLLAVRPDQKDVDASVRRMADPFTEDALARAAAAAAPAVRPGDPRIVEENQEAPGSEEFVPQNSAPPPAPTTATRSFVPPPRNASMPLLQQTGSLAGRPVARTTPMPGRVPPVTEDIPMPRGPKQMSASQILGVPRPVVSPVFATPIAAASSSGPLEPRSAGLSPVQQIPPVTATTVMPLSAKPAPPSEADANELKRLAALAMAEIEEGGSEESLAAESKVEAPTLPPSVPSSAFPAPPASATSEKIEPGFAATSRLQVPQAPVRELSPLASATPGVPNLQQFRVPSTPEPIRLPTLPAEPLRAPVASAEPAAATGVAESIRPPGAQMTPSRATTRMTPPPFASSPPPEPPAAEPPAHVATAINLNNCLAEDLLPIPGITRELANNIVRHRDKIGEFHKLDELLDVPGMTGEAYSNLTGETPSSGVHPSINELLGYPPEQELSLKDVTDRISCWPDVIGCLLSQKNGLHLVGTAPDFLDKEAIVAFAPRMFEDVNKSFNEITGRTTDELIIPTTGTSFHLLREKDLYLIILARLPLMPERHLKIARFVLAGLSTRPS